jgi:hypothetical protein
MHVGRSHQSAIYTWAHLSSPFYPLSLISSPDWTDLHHVTSEMAATHVYPGSVVIHCATPSTVSHSSVVLTAVLVTPLNLTLR